MKKHQVVIGWRAVVRRRRAADPAPPFARGAAGPGRAGQHRRLRAIPARLAPGLVEPGRFRRRSRRPGVHHRAAGRRADTGLGAGAVGAGASGARLLPRDARRAARDRRGHLVGRRSDLGQ